MNKSATAFSDISGHWAREAIEKAAKLGFVNGYEDGTFQPQGLVNRSEFAVMLARAFNYRKTAVRSYPLRIWTAFRNGQDQAYRKLLQRAL